MTDGPAYTRLDVNERRRRLLELGARLFAEHAYADLSMAQIAREAGISKALLYHYFASKQEFFRATLANAIDDLRRRTAPDPSKPPLQQLLEGVDAYLGWIEEHRDAYLKLMVSAQSVDEVRALVDEQRSRTAEQILQGLALAGASAPPAARTAVRGWLWFMDGACVDWIEHGDVRREDVLNLLLGTLIGALRVAGAPPPVAA